MNSDQARTVLDEPGRAQLVDRRNLLRQINEFPEYCETALGLVRSFESHYVQFEPDLVFIMGTGDSSLSAEMVKAAVANQARVPVVSDREGRLPAWAGDKSLVIIVDCGGDSRTAVQCYADAKARKCEIVCAGFGGKLAETSAADGTRMVRIPSGQPPRMAVGFLFVQLLGVLAQYRVSDPAEHIVSTAIKLLKNAREVLRLECPASRNVAKRAAEFMLGKIPVIVGAPGYRSIVATRWTHQIGANAKWPAASILISESAESQISAWELAGPQTPELSLLFLKDATDNNSEVGIAMDDVKRVLDGRCPVMEVEIQGITATERMLYGLYLADYASYYLALLHNVDPTPTVIPRSASFVAQPVKTSEDRQQEELG